MNISLPTEQESFWMPKVSKTYPQLKEDLEVDVAIVGGGIAGVTIGYKLKQAGYRVAIVEKNQLASGTTGGTTGKVSTQHNLNYTPLIKKFGQKNAQVYADAYSRALSDIQAIIKDEKIDCDWSLEDHYVYTNSPFKLKTLEQEAKDAISLGFPASFTKQALPLPFPTEGYLKFENQAKFNASLYTQALASRIKGKGSYVFEKSEVEELEKGSPATVKTKTGSVNAKYVIFATKIPPGPLFARLSYASIVYPENSYLIAGETSLDITGMYNTPDKEHYSLLPVKHGNKTYILVGGENHIPGLGIPDRHYKKLASYAHKWFGTKEVEFKWRAMDYIAYDKLPVIGELYPGSKNIHAISGFKKWGLTTSMVAANTLLEILEGEKTPASKLFYPHRASAPLSAPRAIIKYLQQ